MGQKRFRKPKLKDGELRIYWGKVQYDSPDIILAWQGDSTMKGDTRLLHYHLCCKRPDVFSKSPFSSMNPSLIEELNNRGYDITTLKFSIMKKKHPDKAAQPIHNMPIDTN